MSNARSRWIDAFVASPTFSARFLLGSFAVAAVSVLGSWVGIRFSNPSLHVSALWPPTGLMLAAVFFLGRRALVAGFIGSFLGVVDHISLLAAVGESLASVLSVALCVAVLKAAGFSPRLERLRDALWLAVGAALVCTLPSAVVGPFSLLVTGELARASLGTSIWTWWVGDVAGVLVFAPLVFALVSGRSRGRGGRAEAVGVTLALIAGCAWVFGPWTTPQEGPFAQPFLLLPLAMWAGFRFGARGAALTVAGLSALSTLATVHGVGSFARPDASQGLLLVQLFIAVTSYAALAAAAVTAEQQVSAEQRELLAEAVRSAQEALALLDGSMRIVFANDAFLELAGAPLAAVQGQSLRVLPVDPARVTQLEEACDAGRAGYVETVLPASQAPCLRSAELLVSPVRSRDCGQARFVCFYRDITARKQLQERLTLQERMASVGTLAAGVGHEINNPLSYVMTNLELLHAGLAGRDSALARQASDALDGAERIRVIVEDLNVVTAAGREGAAVDLRRVVRRALDIAPKAVLERLRLREELGEVGAVRGNEARLGQVLLNLLSNAAQAGRDGQPGPVSVALRTRSEGAFCVLEVQDEGRGIPSELLPRIFEPFFTTKPQGEGTGLGLYICHRIVQQHGGDLSVDSAPSRGTLFKVRLPAVAASQALVESPAPVGRRRVLIIDDEPKLALSMKLLLRDEHDVTVETDSSLALERLRSGESFDVILCDLQMPRLSGADLYAAVTAFAPERAQKMIFMSGGAHTEQARAFVSSAKARVIEKPVRPEKLIQLVASEGASLRQ